MVPVKSFNSAPYSRAAVIYIANIGSTAPFIVILTEILFKGIESKRIFISSTESIATPAIPTSPITLS